MPSKALNTYHDKSQKTLSKAVLKAVSDLVESHTGLKPYKEQIKAAKEIAKGNIVDMKTGEGKSLTVLIALLLLLREGRKVYVSTSNDYLCERDYLYAKDLLDMLGFSSAIFRESIGGTESQYANANAIYATGETLIFDYLRGVKAEYDFVIIDEIDYILVESASHDFSVSTNETNVYMPVEMFLMAKKVADFLTAKTVDESVPKEDYLFDFQAECDVIVRKAKRSIEMTTRGYEKVEALFGKSKTDTLFMECLLSSLEAKYLHKRNANYIVENSRIVIINESSGRKSENGSNGVSLQTAIEVKENVPVTAKALLNNTCSFPVFFSIFKTLTGLSGTTSYVPYDFGIIFGKKVVKIREHAPNRRKEIFEYFACENERVAFIKDKVKSCTQPVLIVTRSDGESNTLKEKLKETEKNIHVLDNCSLEKEKELLLEAGKSNSVLISSDIVGRGTDILTNEAEGLTVILAKRRLSERAERQIVGRTGRNGGKGTCYILTCKEDVLFDYEYKKRKTLNEKYIRKLQKRHEQQMFEARKHVYIRSKLFFDQDAAIKKRLSEVKTFRELMSLAEKDAQTKNDFEMNALHKKLLAKIYENKRPYYQAQFLAYNDQMANTLYRADSFNDRCKEYCVLGNEIIKEVAGEFTSMIYKNG